MVNNLKINTALTSSVSTQADAQENIKNAVKSLQADIQKTERTQTVLTLSVLDYALLTSKNSVEGGLISADKFKVYRNVIVDNAEACFPNDDASVKKIKNQSGIPIMSALLCMAENTGFSVGYVLRDSQAYRTSKDALKGKTVGLKDGFRKEIFYNPSKLFPMMHAPNTPKKDEILIPNMDGNLLATQEIIRKAYAKFFDGKALNDLQTDLAPNPRDGEGKQATSVPQNGKDLLATLNLAVQSVEDGIFEKMQPDTDWDSARIKSYNAFKVKVLDALGIIEKGFSDAEALRKTEENVDEIKKISVA